MADGDRPIVLVPLATARKAARRAGVTLNLSADDIALAGKWKHGWIPLDAVASAVKAKRYHGGGGEGHTVKGKGRAGSAVESRREPSRGRTKGALPTRTRTFSDAGDTTVSRREHGLPTGGRKAAKANPVGSKLEHSKPKYVTPGAAKAAATSGLEGKSAGSMRARRDSMGVLVRPTGPVTSTSSGLPSGYRITNDEFGPALYSNGKLLRTTSKGNEHNLVQYAKDHAAGDTSAHPRTVQDQLDAAKAGKASLDGRSAASMSAAERARAAEIMHGTGSKQHRKALATARAQRVAQDRTRRVEAARGGPKLADLSESDLQSLISRYGEKSVQADAARAEMLRRSAASRVAEGGMNRARLADLRRLEAGGDKAARRELDRRAGRRGTQRLKAVADPAKGGK